MNGVPPESGGHRQRSHHAPRSKQQLVVRPAGIRCSRTMRSWSRGHRRRRKSKLAEFMGLHKLVKSPHNQWGLVQRAHLLSRLSYNQTQQSNEQNGRRDASRRKGHSGDHRAPSGARQCFDTNSYPSRASEPRVSMFATSRQHRRDRHGLSVEESSRLWLRSALNHSRPLTQQSTVISKLLILLANINGILNPTHGAPKPVS